LSSLRVKPELEHKFTGKYLRRSGKKKGGID
jgi:hypothetical protein